MSTPPTPPEEPSVQAARRLCPDGTCIGLLDDQNRCKECGAVDDDAPAVVLAVAGDGSQDDGVDALLDPIEDDAAVFDANRPLCPDGACVGVLGADGRCKECGRSAEG